METVNPLINLLPSALECGGVLDSPDFDSGVRRFDPYLPSHTCASGD